ncbi:hypothetical protein SLEP1_g42236 [Rubroshorea leprosula]|uniref:Uncharacterized protein n=1 Tax=Rubroshorea leprosula TaxID=152421 RepID=A0AAV5LA35_9ROSI|nr:hypothetical protein SLEP1_g42236 [Rubroshorea leprosula]
MNGSTEASKFTYNNFHCWNLLVAGQYHWGRCSVLAFEFHIAHYYFNLFHEHCFVLSLCDEMPSAMGNPCNCGKTIINSYYNYNTILSCLSE